MPLALIKHAYVSLATHKRNGDWVWTPIWYAPLDDQEYVAFSAGAAGKVKRIRNFPEVKVMACTASGRPLSGDVAGVARLIDDPSTCEAAYSALQEKYRWQLSLLNFFSRLSGNINRRQVIGFTLSNQDAQTPVEPFGSN